MKESKNKASANCRGFPLSFGMNTYNLFGRPTLRETQESTLSNRWTLAMDLHSRSTHKVSGSKTLHTFQGGEGVPLKAYVSTNWSDGLEERIHIIESFAGQFLDRFLLHNRPQPTQPRKERAAALSPPHPKPRQTPQRIRFMNLTVTRARILCMNQRTKQPPSQVPELPAFNPTRTPRI